MVDWNKNENGDDDNHIFDGRSHEDVVGHELGREVDPVSAATNHQPNDGHEEKSFAKFLFLEQACCGGKEFANSGVKCVFPI